LNKKEKRKRVGCAAVLLFIFLIAALLFSLRFILLSSDVSEYVRKEIQVRTTDALNTELFMGELEVDIWGRVVAENIRLGNEEEPLLTAKKLYVRLDLLKLLRIKTDPGGIIKEIIIDTPVFHIIRLQDGSYNHDPILKSSSGGGGSSMPSLKVCLKKGRILFEDRHAEAPYPLDYVEVSDFSGTFSLLRERALKLELSSDKTNIADNLGINLYFDLRAGWELDVEAGNVALDLAEKFLSLDDYRLTGSAESLHFYAVAAFTRIGNPPNFSWGGEAEINGAGFFSRDGLWKAENIKTEINFSETMTVFHDIEAEFCEGIIRGNSTILDYSDPVVNANVIFEKVDLYSLTSRFDPGEENIPRGHISGSGILKYSDSKINSLLAFSGNDLDARGNRFNEYEGLLQYRDGKSEFKISLFSDQGGIDSMGVYYVDEKGHAQYRVAAKYNNLKLGEWVEQFGIESSRPVEGDMSGEVLLANGEPGEPPDLFGSINVSGIYTKGFDNASANASFRYSKGEFIIENLLAECGDQLVIADGKISPDGYMDISIDAAIGEVATVLALSDREDVPGSGTIKLSGFIRGKPAEPIFNGDIEGKSIVVSDVKLDRFTGSVDYEDGFLKVSNFSLYSGDDRNIIQGVLNTRDNSIDANASIKNGSIESLVSLARDILRVEIETPEDFSGRFDADLDVGGTLEEPVASLTFNGRDINMYGEYIGAIKLAMEYDKFLKIDEATLEVAGGEIGVSGILDPEALDLIFETKGIKPEKVAAASDLNLEGLLVISGSLSGTLESPVVKVIFSSDHISFRGVDFQIANGSVDYMDDLFQINGLNIKKGEENYSIQARYDLASSGLDLTMSLENSALNTLVSFMPLDFLEGTSGYLNGQCRIFTYAEDLAGVISLKGEGLTFGSYPVDGLVLDGNFVGSELNISEFRAENELLLVEASGKLDLEQGATSKLNVAAYGVELERLQQMGLISIPVKGMADVTIDVIGDEGSQKMIGSIEAYNPSVYDVAFDRARGRFELDSEVFSLINMQVLRGTDNISVYAEIPVSRESEENIDIIAQSENLDLSFLNPVFESSGIQIEGVAGIHEVRLSGNFDNPNYSGSIQLQNASFNHVDINPPLTELNGELVFDGQKMDFKSVTGKMGEKDIGLKGGVAFEGLTPGSVSLGIEDIEGLIVEYKDIYKGQLSIENFMVEYVPGLLKIKGDDNKTTKVTIHDGVFTIPTLTEGSSTKKPGMEIGFGDKNFNIIVADNFAVRNAGRNLYLQPSGQLQLAGTLAKPEIKGLLTAKRGYINFYTTSFKLTDKTIIGFNTLQGIGVVPIFYAVAETRAEGIDITMYVSGPMLDINLYPAYRELCGVSEISTSETQTSLGVNIPTITLGDGINVPVCPRHSFVAYEDNNTSGKALTQQEILMKLGYLDVVSSGENIDLVLQSMAFSAFSPYFGSFIERGINLENFEINLDPNRDVLVKLEKRIFDKFSVRYERLFSQELEELLEVRFKFSQRSFLKWGIDQDSETDYQVEYRLRF